MTPLVKFRDLRWLPWKFKDPGWHCQPNLGTYGDHLKSLGTWMTPSAKFRDLQYHFRSLETWMNRRLSLGTCGEFCSNLAVCDLDVILILCCLPSSCVLSKSNSPTAWLFSSWRIFENLYSKKVGSNKYAIWHCKIGRWLSLDFPWPYIANHEGSLFWLCKIAKLLWTSSFLKGFLFSRMAKQWNLATNFSHVGVALILGSKR